MKVSSNPIDTVRTLLNILDVKVTDKSINKIKYKSDYPSLNSLSNWLLEWNINNVAVRIEPHQLNEIPYPAIAHLRKNGGHYVVLQGVSNEKVTYIDSESGIVEETLTAFQNKATGVFLLIESNKNSGEKEFASKQRATAFNEASKFTIPLLLIVLAFPSVAMQLQFMIFYLLCLTGSIIGIVLLQKQFGAETLISKVCKRGGRLDCDAVINSKYSKLFGVVHLSEIVVVYFLGSTFWMILAFISTRPIPYGLVILTVFSAPFIPLSLWYQWKVIGKWCSLCLMIISVLLLQFAILLPMITSPAFNIIDLWIGVFSFSVPIIGWLAIRQRYLSSFEVEGMEKKLYRFESNEIVFQSLLENQPEVNVGILKHEVKTNSDNAPIKIVIVSSPVCGPCFSAHRIVKDVKEQFGESIQIIYRFLISEENSLAKDMFATIITNWTLGKNDLVHQAIHEWYSKKDSPKTWLEKFDAKMIDKEQIVQEAINEHSVWAANTRIQETPVVIINNKVLPEEFSLNDLHFQIHKLLELKNLSFQD